MEAGTGRQGRTPSHGGEEEENLLLNQAQYPSEVSEL